MDRIVESKYGIRQVKIDFVSLQRVFLEMPMELLPFLIWQNKKIFKIWKNGFNLFLGMIFQYQWYLLVILSMINMKELSIGMRL